MGQHVRAAKRRATIGSRALAVNGVITFLRLGTRSHASRARSARRHCAFLVFIVNPCHFLISSCARTPAYDDDGDARVSPRARVHSE